jgi:hypothetical protein
MFGAGTGPGEAPYDKKKKKKEGAAPEAKKAVKCDMCKDLPGGAACVRACPRARRSASRRKNSRVRADALTRDATGIGRGRDDVGKSGTMEYSFLSHGNYRWLWVATVLVVASIAAYALYQPSGGIPNGGTWYGYTTGTIGALLIYWLTSFGIRKRRYASNLGTLRGWLSAHIYPRHGADHRRPPPLRVPVRLEPAHARVHPDDAGHRVGLLRRVHLRPLSLADDAQPRQQHARRDARGDRELDQNMLALADGIDPKIHAVVLRSIENTRLGGGPWRLLTARDASDQALGQVRAALEAREPARSRRSRPSRRRTAPCSRWWISWPAPPPTSRPRRCASSSTCSRARSRSRARGARRAVPVADGDLAVLPRAADVRAARGAHRAHHSVFFYW